MGGKEKIDVDNFDWIINGEQKAFHDKCFDRYLASKKSPSFEDL